MNSKNNRIIKLISNFLLGLAIIGFLILWLKYGGRSVYKSKSNDISSIYPLLAGVSLILPYLFYVILYKRKLKHIGKIKKIRNENESEIFILNKSKKTVIINHISELEDNQWHIFKIKKMNHSFLITKLFLKLMKKTI
ncbi:hypothetical protein [Flavobacterium channae]|uniref:hypothetical protein n=1 Tax=Flavobacterium channae TaxID=2897181 RepID=UPI001E475178|nr:hypothetical protein [Flavobacterium channae]UGS22522.1 hypothetical protein LOS89_06980 [Flavobacterium channae]